MPPHTLTTAFLSCGLLLAAGSPLAASPAPPAAAPVTPPAAAPAVLGGPLALVAHDPPRHARDLPTHGIVRLTFDQPLDFSTVGPDAVEVMGLWSGVTDVRYIPADGGRTLILTPRQPFFPGEQVTVQVTTLLQGTSGATLPEGGQMLQYWVAPAPGNLEFVHEDIVSTRLPGESLVRSYGIHAADLDGDGAPDFSIPNEVSDDVRVIRTDGCGNLLPIEVHPLNQGDTPSANAMLDMDDDGDLDFAVCGWAGDRVNLLEGDGSGDFAPMVSYRAGDVPRGIAAVDVEGDGDTDLVLAHRTSSDLGLMRNLGGGVFGPVTMFEGGGDGETALVAADMDNDGLWDLVVAHYLSYEASVLHGDGTGAFTVVDVDPVGTRPWMIVAGDLDGDGQLDAATCNSGSSNASVLRGTPAGGLQNDQLLPLGHFSVAIDLADMDGDGDLDLVNSSFSSQLWRVHENDGTGTFASSFDLPATLAASCATLVDYDRDGFVDLVGMDELSD